MTSVSACVPLKGAPVPVLLSVALTVKLKLPAAVGVPESAPLLLKVTPAGSAPLVMANVYGDVPPLAVIVCAYAAATVPPATLVCVMATVGAASVKLYAWLPLYGPVPVEESVALMVKLSAPPTVGVPVIAPVLLFSARPAGSAPTETL
jgi:hypothetical protein